MKKVLLFLSLFLSTTLLANNSIINDTIHTESDIRIFYKSKHLIDSVYIFDKKFKLKERGHITGNIIKFYNTEKNITAIGGFDKNNLQGNFLYFKDGKLYKTVNIKDGKEQGIALIFDKDGHLELLYENINGKSGGLSVLFEKRIPKYIRTEEIGNDSTTLIEFSKDGKLESLSFPNNFEIEKKAKEIMTSKL